jgi:hypothetical protein
VELEAEILLHKEQKKKDDVADDEDVQTFTWRRGRGR